MKHVEGKAFLGGFNFGIDWDEIMERGMAKFIDLVLEQAPPKLIFARLKTIGDPIRDTVNGYGMQPDDPLTLRLYLESFNPDDGSSIMFDQSLDKMVDDYYTSYDPSKDKYVELRDALAKLVQKMDENIVNWNPPNPYDDDES